MTNLSIESKPASNHFTFSGCRSEPNLNSNSISFGKLDSSGLHNALSEKSEERFNEFETKSYTRSLSHQIRVTSQSAGPTAYTVTTYFVQKELQPLDIQLLWKERDPYLRIDGLQTVSYYGTRPIKRTVRVPKDKVETIVFPDHVLEVDLSKTGITKEIGLISGARIDQNPWAKDLCGFMKELTGYELQMLCNVEKVKIGPPENGLLGKMRRPRKRGPALLLLWRSPTDTPDFNTTYWITLRFVESSHGEKQWFYGKRE